MHVLCATDRTQGQEPDDYCWTIDGELVRLPWIECADGARCGCARGLAGLGSQRATTTAEVVDRPELDILTYAALLVGELEDDGVTVTDEVRAAALRVGLHLLVVAAAHPPGTVVGRAGDGWIIRERPGDT